MDKNIKNQYTVTTTTGDVTVTYWPGCRLSQFMAKNNLIAEDEAEYAAELFRICHAQYVKAVVEETANQVVVQAKQSAKFKNGVFVIGTTIQKEGIAERNDNHDALVRQWLNKKRADALKAQERVKAHLATR